MYVFNYLCLKGIWTGNSHYNDLEKVKQYYEPIAEKYLFSGAAIVIVIFIYLVYGNIDMEFNWFPEMKMQQIDQLNLLDKLPNFNISNIYVYAFLGLAFFVGVQVYLLKNHFNKRYSLD